MKARYASACTVCKRAIQPGQEIKRDEELGWIHHNCDLSKYPNWHAALVDQARENENWDVLEWNEQNPHDPLFSESAVYDLLNDMY